MGDSPYSLYKDVMMPTTTDICTFAHFTSLEHHNLIIAKAHVLYVYTFEPTLRQQVQGGQQPQEQQKSDMRLAYTFPLHGTIVDVVSVKRSASAASGSALDYLLLSFNDAKMSLIEFSYATQNIVTVSIHYYEKEEFKRTTLTEKRPARLIKDPQNRCVAMSFYNDRLAILPFRQDGFGTGASTREKHPYFPSFVIQLTSIDPKIRNVVDMVFLYDYFEPTIAILYEPLQTWTGRLAVSANSQCLSIISIDLTQTSSPTTLFKVESLPYNNFSLIPVPSPVGGVVIMSPNSLIHVDQTSVPGILCSLNAFYGWENKLPTLSAERKKSIVYKDSDIIDHSKLGISLEGSGGWFINPDTMLIVMRSGEMLLASLKGKPESGQGWKRRKGGVLGFQIDRIGLAAVQPSCWCGLYQPMNENSLVDESLRVAYLFLGSRTSDSVLIKVTDHNVHDDSGAMDTGGDGDGGDLDDDLYSTKKSSDTSISLSSATTTGFDDYMDDDDFIYGHKAAVSYRKETPNSSPPSTPASTATSVDLGSSVGAVLATGSSSVGVSIAKDLKFKFQMLWSFVCLAPFHSIATGTPHQYSEFETHRKKPRGYFDPQYSQSEKYIPPPLDVEIVGCIGHKSKGAIAVVQQNMRPQILSSFNMEGVNDIWSIKCRRVSKSKNGDLNDGEDFHKYLILSRNNNTMIVETGEEFSEVERRGSFYREGATVSAGTMFEYTTIIQIHPNGVNLLDSDAVMLHQLSIGDDDEWIVSASIEEPYISLMMNNGQVLLLQVLKDKNGYELKILKELKGTSPISACHLYSEMTANPVLLNRRVDPGVLSTTVDAGDETSSSMDETRDEELQHFCVLTREDGCFEILKVPSLDQCFRVPRLDLMRSTLIDIKDIGSTEEEEINAESLKVVEIEEVLLVRLGIDETRQDCYLFARCETGDLMIYKIFTYPCADRSRLAIRLTKAHNAHMTRTKVMYSDTTGDKLNPVNTRNTEGPAFLKKHYLRKFNEVGERMPHCGVFVSGKRPFFVIMAKSGDESIKDFDVIQDDEEEGDGEEAATGVAGSSGKKTSLSSVPQNTSHVPAAQRQGDMSIYIHPAIMDGNVLCFADFHNINCRKGFVYFTQQNELRICRLLPQFQYDNEFPFCKVILGRTPHKIANHFESSTYVMATSKPTPFHLERAKYAAALSSGVIDEKDESAKPQEPKKLEPGYYRSHILQYTLELVSPVTWETVDMHELDEGEYVLSMEAVTLENKQTTTGVKLYIAVGTAYYRGEDLSTRGRILLFDVIDVVPEPNNPQTNHKLKLLYVSDEKSPVTAVCGINGYLLAAIGSKIIIHQFENSEELSGIAFLDVNLMVTSVCSMKNIILAGDIIKGSILMVFQEDPPTLTLLSKDFHPMQVMSTGCLVNENELNFIVTDNLKNLHIFQYNPYNVLSIGGKKLIRRADFHTGSSIQMMTRSRRLVRNPITGQQSLTRQHFNICATCDGGLSMITPVPEKMYLRLYALYSKMVNQRQHYAGLNPRGFRQADLRQRPVIPAGPPGPKVILDGNLIFEFTQLSIRQREELARSIGSNVDVLMDDLLELITGIEFY